MTKLTEEVRKELREKMQNENYEKEFVKFRINSFKNDWAKVLNNLGCLDMNADDVKEDFFQEFLMEEIHELKHSYRNISFDEEESEILKGFITLSENYYIGLETCIDGYIFAYLTTNAENAIELDGIDEHGDVTDSEALKKCILKLHKEKFKKIKEPIFEYKIKEVVKNGIKKFWLQVDEKYFEDTFVNRLAKAFNFDFSRDGIQALYSYIRKEPLKLNNKEILKKIEEITEAYDLKRFQSEKSPKTIIWADADLDSDCFYFGAYDEANQCEFRIRLTESNPQDFYPLEERNKIKDTIKAIIELLVLLEKRQELIKSCSEQETITIK